MAVAGFAVDQKITAAVRPDVAERDGLECLALARGHSAHVASGLFGLAFLHEARPGGARQFLALAAYGLGRAGVPLALLHEARFRRAGKRLAMFRERLRFRLARSFLSA